MTNIAELKDIKLKDLKRKTPAELVTLAEELEVENGRLKKMYAELSLTHHALQDAVEKKLRRQPRAASW